MSVEHVLVCYGEQLGYHHGAKYQILRAIIGAAGQDLSFCVVTDRPELFQNYPCRLIFLDSHQKKSWSLGEQDHFGIKILGLSLAATTSLEQKVVLLDTDMYWVKPTEELFNRIDSSTILLFKNEGLVYGSKNKSIQRFEQGLAGKSFPLNSVGGYKLSEESEMWGSAIIGITPGNSYLLDRAFELFVALNDHVDAHTVEQFAISETIRLNGMKKIEGQRYVSHWSSIGRKNYVTLQLAHFFNTYGENDYLSHLDHVKEISIKRPLAVLLSQKFERWK